MLVTGEPKHSRKSGRLIEASDIVRLAKERRAHKVSGSWGLGLEVAQNLVRIRGGFGDLCWQAWFAHELGQLDEALRAIEAALLMNSVSADAQHLRKTIEESMSRVRLEAEALSCKAIEESEFQARREAQEQSERRRRLAEKARVKPATVGLVIAVTQMDTWVVKRGSEVLRAFETYDEAVAFKTAAGGYQ
jgi:hypothetical protein